MLDAKSFKQHLTGLIEQSINPVCISGDTKSEAKRSVRFLLAFSGGLDSHVLLHLLHQAKLPFRAVYIDHGLQQASIQWGEHCRQVCQSYEVPFNSIKVSINSENGDSLEASARHARYHALANELKPDEILLTAQHLNDQSETLMLQLLRTAGPAGLAAMPQCKRFASSWHLRPLLQTPREHLQAYAKHHQLQWIEDPSNEDQRFDRNFFRHAIFPLLQQRWPSVHQTFANVSQLQAEASQLINELAEIDAKDRIEHDRLDIDALIKLSLPRQRNLVRYWLQQLDLDTPTAKRLDEILTTMITAAEDKQPIVQWQQTEVRRFQNKLYAMKALQPVDLQRCYQISQNEIPVIEGLRRQLHFEQNSQGLSEAIFNQNLTIRFRNGGEKIRPIGRAHTMDLKKLFQQAGIPPWLRNRIPLLYLDDSLIAVADLWVAESCKNDANRPGWLLKSRVL